MLITFINRSNQNLQTVPFLETTTNTNKHTLQTIKWALIKEACVAVAFL